MIAMSRRSFDRRLRFWFSSQSRFDSVCRSGRGRGAGDGAVPSLGVSRGRNSGSPDGVMGWRFPGPVMRRSFRRGTHILNVSNVHSQCGGVR